ncbi:MAG: Arm DNA-binding domain-containing protein, partial [Cocleimonas sp.]
MALTHTAVSNAKPKEKVYKIFDGGGLYLQVKPTGYKAWKYDFRLGATRGTYTIGQYPDIKLADAREAHRRAREHVAKGINPKVIKEDQRVAQDLNDKRFSYYANDWLERQHLADSTYKDLKQRIEKNLTPYLDIKNVNEFSTSDLLKIMTKMS